MLKIGILIFPSVEEMDFVAPFEVLSYINKVRPQSTKVSLIAESLDVVPCFEGMRVLPDFDITNCPKLDILIVPGGKGRLAAMENKQLLSFIKAQSKNTLYTASVCTGAFVLAAAELLNEKKATTYHAAIDELSAYPTTTAITNKKVVHDGKIITAAGVTSGLELGFYLLKLLFGIEYAKTVAEKIEYHIDLETL